MPPSTDPAVPRRGQPIDLKAADSPWISPHRLTIWQQRQGHADFSQLDARFDSDSDFLIDVQSRADGQETKGSILVVAGRAMLWTGLPLPAGYEIDSLDGAAVTVQLVVCLLMRCAPEGPEYVGGQWQVNVEERERGISLNTRSASGGMPAPWSAKGWVRAQGPATFDYELQLSSPVGPPSDPPLVLKGSWSREPGTHALDDGMSIEGWSVHRLGPVERRHGGTTTIDFSSQAISRQARTLGEMRRWLAD